MQIIEVQKPAIVVGAGIAGLALANALAAQGRKVLILERRSREQVLSQKNGRSFNFTLTNRGLKVLSRLGLGAATLELAQSISGRELHHDEKSEFCPYSSKGLEKIYSISRIDLTRLLLEAIDLQQDVEIKFNSEVETIDFEATSLEYFWLGKRQSANGEFIVGADGAYSKSRAQFLKTRPIAFSQDFFRCATWNSVLGPR